MGFFTKQSKKETEERIKWAAERHGDVDEALKAYKKGKADKEELRRTLEKHDDYFKYVD